MTGSLQSYALPNQHSRTMTRKKNDGTPFYREIVLSILAMADGWVTARYISETSGLTYKQTIDSLNYLYNTEKVARAGRKSTARWGRCDLLGKAGVTPESKILTMCLLRGYMRA